MGKKPWRPADEAEATSNRGVFIEWLHATGREPEAGPDDVPAWQSDLDAMAEFGGLRRNAGWAGNLRRHRGRREAVVRLAPSRRAWSRDALADSDAAWQQAAGTASEQPWENLVRIVASHLLDAETRPDDRLLWGGDPCDPWPWGALAIGATLILDGGEADAAAEAAMFRRLAPGWGGR